MITLIPYNNFILVYPVLWMYIILGILLLIRAYILVLFLMIENCELLTVEPLCVKQRFYKDKLLQKY